MEWDIAKVTNLINDQVEERIDLEYKGAASLEKNDKKKAEIVKDISAMANSAGGTIIYGVNEYNEVEKRHLPEKISPIDRNVISKEWLESIANNIQPRVSGIIIHSLDIDKNGGVIYVVEIPQSFTAHQNPYDKKYYKRFNFSAEPMNDYEIRDIMNRGSSPIIDLTFRIKIKIEHIVVDSFMSRMPGQTRDVPKTNQIAYLAIYAENKGNVYARHVEGYVEIDHSILGEYLRDNTSQNESGLSMVRFDNVESIWNAREIVGKREVPVLPGMNQRIGTINLDFSSVLGEVDGEIKWSVYTESSNPRLGKVDLSQIEKEITEGRYSQDLLGNKTKLK